MRVWKDIIGKGSTVQSHDALRERHVCGTESSMTQQARTVYGYRGSEKVPRVRLDSTH